MSIAEDFKALVLERPTLDVFINRIQEKPWGCTYVFDGIMNCCIVFDRGKYADVQDVEDGWEPWQDTGHGPMSVWARFDSVLSLVLNMEEVLTP